MKNNWGAEVEDHAEEDCYPCHGSRFYALPLDCAPGRCEDEANCECDCHLSEQMVATMVANGDASSVG